VVGGARTRALQPGDEHAGPRHRPAPEDRTAPAVAGLVSVVEAVERELDDLRTIDARLADSGLAALALAMAREIDSSGNSATSKAMCAGRLHDAMDRLRELTPDEQERTQLDELTERRAKRQHRAKTAS
jgi:hypothetical protein